MAKPRCKKHKRSLPYCDDCKAAVAQAEKEEQSEALKAEVGFPKNEATNDEPETDAERRIVELAAETEEDEQAPADEAEEPERAMVGITVAEEIPDPWANGKTPAVGDDVGDWKPPAERENPPDDVEDWLESAQAKEEAEGPPPEGQVSDAEAAGYPPCPKPKDSDGGTVDCQECGGKCQGHPDEGAGDIPLSPEGFEKIREIVEALDGGAEVTVVIGDAHEELRQEGREEVVGWVKEYFADSIDTGAFQLIAYLERRCT